MKIILRKISHIPNRLKSFSKHLSYVVDCLIKSSKEAFLISRCKRKVHLRGERMDGIAVINAGRFVSATDIEFYLAHILTLNGLTVYMLFDDGVLEHWDSSQVHKLNYYSPYRAKWFIRYRCIIRKNLMYWAYHCKRLKVLNYSTIMKKIDLNETIDKTDIRYAVSSTKRFFETGLLNVDGIHRDYYQKSLKNCMISKTIANYVLDTLRPDLYLTSHYVYSVWGPAYRRIKEAGIAVLSNHIVGTTIGKFRLTDQNIQTLSQSIDWREFDNNIPLSSEEVRQGEQLINERIGHNAYDLMEYFPDGADEENLERLNIQRNGMTFGMFPNVVWDGDLPERNIVFDNVVDWCTVTIEALRNTPHYLFIRFHPAETTRLKGSKKLEEILREKISNIDDIENLTLIGSDEKIDTYKFAQKNIDIGLIYDGTLSLELTYMGIPVVACTNGLYTLDSIVYKPKTLDDYHAFLREPASVLSKFAREKDERKANACKYAYWLFKESLLEFKPLEKPYPGIINYKLVGKDESMSEDDQRVSERLMRPLQHAYHF